MNCHTVQNKILSLTDPRVLPMAIGAHLAGCAACQVWAKQAAKLEAILEQLPVPAAPGNKKAEMVEDLAGNTLVISRPLNHASRASLSGSVLKFLHQNSTVVGGLAAAVLVVLGGWWLLFSPGDKPVTARPEPERDPFLEKMVQRYISLAKAETPAKRLQVYGEMADDLAIQERTLARVVNSDGLMDMAQLFDKVVKDGMVKQAKKLPFATLDLNEREDRKKQLETLAGRLNEVAKQLETLKGEVPPDAKPALQKIADSARDGEKELRTLSTAG